MKDATITRIIIERDDGTAMFVEGEDAKTWQAYVGGLEGMAIQHKIKPPPLKWKVAKAGHGPHANVYFELTDELVK